MSDDCLQRLADNERLLREANLEIEHKGEDWLRGNSSNRDELELELFCACGRRDCDERLLIAIDEYERIQSHPHRFVIVPSHANPDAEHVVETHAAYEVVEKRPAYQE